MEFLRELSHSLMIRSTLILLFTLAALDAQASTLIQNVNLPQEVKEAIHLHHDIGHAHQGARGIRSIQIFKTSDKADLWFSLRQILQKKLKQSQEAGGLDLLCRSGRVKLDRCLKKLLHARWSVPSIAAVFHSYASDFSYTYQQANQKIAHYLNRQHNPSALFRQVCLENGGIVYCSFIVIDPERNRVTILEQEHAEATS